MTEKVKRYIITRSYRPGWYRIIYKLNNQIHNDNDEPAVICSSGIKKWYKYGELHRENGPAIIFADGSEVWYKHGEITHKDN